MVQLHVLFVAVGIVVAVALIMEPVAGEEPDIKPSSDPFNAQDGQLKVRRGSRSCRGRHGHHRHSPRRCHQHHGSNETSTPGAEDTTTHESTSESEDTSTKSSNSESVDSNQPNADDTSTESSSSESVDSNQPNADDTSTESSSSESVDSNQPNANTPEVPVDVSGTETGPV